MTNMEQFRTAKHVKKETVVVGSLEHAQLLGTQLEVNNFYVIKYPSVNDETGAEEFGTDVGWFHTDIVEGKKVKVIRFCKLEKCLKFSQMVGMKFFGPVMVGG
jgi:hypothetical protein